MTIRKTAWSSMAIVLVAACMGCTPTIRIAAPDKPITINLNVRIDQEVRVRLDKEIEDLIAQNPDLF
ncbi:MAG: YnbE family lipoprotein [Alphaproteobacteria bacterium]|nr:YnbE family lipoprotein [Alphaproteobacteria bacterium]